MGFEDLTSSLQGVCLGAFGEQVVYQVDGLPDALVRGIFRAPYIGTDPGLAAEVQSEAPELHVRLDKLPAQPGRGHHVVVRGVRYLVHESQEDGEGITRLLLHEDPLT